MAKKDKKKRLLSGSDIALAILAALGGAVAFMTIIAVAGSIMLPDSGKRATAEAPSAQPSYYGTLPSRAPDATPTPSPVESSEEPSNEPEPDSSTEPDEQATVPTQAAAPAQTSTPSLAATQAPTPTPTRTPTMQNPAPAISIQPVQQSQAPAQSGNQGNNSSGSYAQNFAAGKVLATTASNNNNDPVYHTSYCTSAQRIAASDMYWYDSEQAARDDGRRLCGNCAR